MAIEDKLKTALDESRLLILGAQILFGFQFDAVFQELFSDIPVTSRYVHCAGLVLLLVSVGLMIAPALFHQITFAGQARPGAIRIASVFAGASLLPLTLGLGAATFVTFEQLFNRGVGIAAGISFTAIGLGLLYGFGLACRHERKKSMAQEKTDTGTSLKAGIEQMLTEARVIIPGAQALLGFQLIAVLTRAFNELPPVFKYIHCVGLSAVAVSALLLMTPAALHRIGFHGEDNQKFFEIGSRLIVAGTIPLAVGIASGVAVVFFKAIDSESIAMASGLVSLALLLGLWLGYPWLVARHTASKSVSRRATG